MNAWTHADSDTYTLMRILHRVESSIQPALYREIMQRLEVVRVGLLYRPIHWEAILQKLDPQLRLRIALEQGNKLIIERWPGDDADDGWLKVCDWPHDYPKKWPSMAWLTHQQMWVPYGQTPWTPLQVVRLLEENDMQRVGAHQHRLNKKAAAEATRQANDKAGDEKILAAIDSLSSKQIQNFCQVEHAIATGDTVTLHGDDMKRFDFMRQASTEFFDKPKEG